MNEAIRAADLPKDEEGELLPLPKNTFIGTLSDDVYINGVKYPKDIELLLPIGADLIGRFLK